MDDGGRAPAAAGASTGGRRRARRPRRRRLATVFVVTFVATLWAYPRVSAMVHPVVVEPLPTTPHEYADGSYAFLETQPNDPARPVGFNPCKQVLLRVNLQGAPPDAMDLVFQAIDDIRHASGIRLAYAGDTPDRPRYDRGRIGPVLVAWAPASEVPMMNGGVVGVGGSGAYAENYGHTKYYVSGQVVLDADDFQTMDRATQQAVVDHEFGHLIGLGHVPAKNELMYPTYHGQLQFGHGDLTGLAKLGKLSCR